MKTTRLNAGDWTQILKAKEFLIGTTILTIQPFSILDLSILTVKVRPLFKALKESGITSENIESPESLAKLFELVVNNAPEILEVACGLHADDIKRLPVTVGVCLLKDVIDVNLESQGEFAEAMKGLGKLLAPTPEEMIAEEEQKAGE